MNLFEMYDSLIEDLGTSLQAAKNNVKLKPMSVNDEVLQLLKTATARCEAAIKGRQVADRIKDPVQRERHKSRMTANYNTILALVNRLKKIL